MQKHLVYNLCGPCCRPKKKKKNQDLEMGRAELSLARSLLCKHLRLQPDFWWIILAQLTAGFLSSESAPWCWTWSYSQIQQRMVENASCQWSFPISSFCELWWKLIIYSRIFYLFICVLFINFRGSKNLRYFGFQCLLLVYLCLFICANFLYFFLGC